MDKIEISGGNPLEGKIFISGSKNSALPILAASLLTKDKVFLDNIPDLTDISSMVKLLEYLGVEVKKSKKKYELHGNFAHKKLAPYELVRKMRASFLVLGPLLSRYGEAKVSLPGGCAIGARPVDLHLRGLQKMGAIFEIQRGYVNGVVKNGLKGAEINLEFSSVGATENLLMAAAIANGQTIIRNAAIEPEIGDLIYFLNRMGADIEGVGTKQLIINGKTHLKGCSYKIMPDRIEAGTYALAVIGCSGRLEINDLNKEVSKNLMSLLGNINETNIEVSKNFKKIIITANTNLSKKLLQIKTSVYPGFPTDLQAQLSAAKSISNHETTIEETIFENRFMHIPELMRMGAKFDIKGNKIKIFGQKCLYGAEVMATDLRASSSLIIAGLMAKGKTVVNRVYHLDRGYENIEQKLSSCCAKIKRI